MRDRRCDTVRSPGVTLDIYVAPENLNEFYSGRDLVVEKPSYGRVQSVKLLPRHKDDPLDGTSGLCATVAFMDIKSASKAHLTEHKLDERCLSTEYYEPAAIPGHGPGQSVYPAPRFSHGPPEDLAAFDRSSHFYERGREGEAYIRRSNSAYHVGVGAEALPRGRTRDRIYRNGPPFNPIIDRTQATHHRSLPGAWNSYDGSASSRYATPPAAVPESYAEEPIRREVHKKRVSKARSGAGTGSESGSQSGSSRSRSRSPSRSSESSSHSSASSCSSASSSPGSDKSVSPHRSVASSHHGSVRSSVRLGSAVQSAVTAPHQNNSSNHSDDSRPLVICVRNLPIRSSDTSLKDGLFHEYKKHGKVTCVKVVGQAEDRYALVRFKKPEDAEKALEESHNKLFFGCKIEVAAYQGYDVDDNEFRPYEAELDEYHPKATRTLFIGNLEKEISPSEIRKHFEPFGEIIEIDIKKQGGATSYAFCQFADISSVVKAMRSLDGEHLGNNRIKLGFGKSMQTNCVWVGGVADNVPEKYLNLQFNQYGVVTQVSVDRERGYALIFFEQVVAAQMAVKEMRGVTLRGRKLQVDFASRECQDAFFVHLEKQGGSSANDRSWRETPYDSRWVATSPKHPHAREVQANRFETTVVVPGGRFSRYESTPQRQRTASYSRSGTPGSTSGNVTPSGSSTPVGVTRVLPRTPRSSSQRYELYDPPSASDFSERRYRSYDEFSTGSGGASGHSDGYEGSPSLRGGGESGGSNEIEFSKRLQSVVVSEPGLAHPHQHPHGSHHGAHHQHHPHQPQELRHLQKERLHLQHQLEQLEDGDSSADEAALPRKRVRVDDAEVIVDALHNHRRSVSEVRRLSESGKHCGRRQSTDSGKHSTLYSPHPVCKRRKTGSSTSENEERRHHHHHHHNSNIDVTVLSGNESGDNSRPGTPLFDERPENILPSEPRRAPRERINDGPLSLPLPRFAAQMQFPPRQSANKPSISSPPLVTSPKPVSLPPPSPSPSPAPPPASPPPRPPSAPSPSSSDSPATSPKHSPTLDHSLDERVKALEKMYEAWTGSRAICASGGDALAKVDTSVTERLRSKHKLLDLDLNGMQPSEIVKSVLAKRSVFDEDSKRLENVGDKYEPKEFVPVTRALRLTGLSDNPVKSPASPSALQSVPKIGGLFSSPLPSPSQTVPKSPFSTCTTASTTTAKAHVTSPLLTPCPKLSISMPKTPGAQGQGLQYPFPSHPPVQPTTSVATTTASGLLSVVTTTSTITSTPTSRPASPETARLKLTVTTNATGIAPSAEVAGGAGAGRLLAPAVTGGVTACVSGSDPRLTKMVNSSPTTAVTACSGNTPSPEAMRTTSFSGLASPEGSRLSASAAASPPPLALQENSPKNLSGQVCASSIPSRLSASQAIRNIPVSADTARTVNTSLSASCSVVNTMTAVMKVTAVSPTVVTTTTVNAIPVSSPSTVPSPDITKSNPKKDMTSSQQKPNLKKETLPSSPPSQCSKDKLSDSFAKVPAPSRRESASSSTSTASSSSKKDVDLTVSKFKNEEKKEKKEIPSPISSRRDSDQDSERRRDKPEAAECKENRKKDRESENQKRKDRESVEHSEKDKSRKHHVDRKESKEGSPPELDRRKDDKKDHEKSNDRRKDEKSERRREDKSEKRKESSEKVDRHRDDKTVERRKDSVSIEKSDRRKEERKEAERERHRDCDRQKEDVSKDDENPKEPEKLLEKLYEGERQKDLEKQTDQEKPKDFDRHEEERPKEEERNRDTQRLADLEQQKEADKLKELERQKDLERQKELERKREDDSRKKDAQGRKENEKQKDCEKPKKPKDSDKHSDRHQERQKEREERKKEERRHTTDSLNERKKEDAPFERKHSTEAPTDRKHDRRDTSDVDRRKEDSHSDRRKEGSEVSERRHSHGHGHHGHSHGHSHERRESTSSQPDRSERKREQSAVESSDRRKDSSESHAELVTDKRRDSSEKHGAENQSDRRKESSDRHRSGHAAEKRTDSSETMESSVSEDMERETEEVSDRRKDKHLPDERRKERKEKERSNPSAPLPAPIGGKRRLSSQDSVEGSSASGPEENKRLKLSVSLAPLPSVGENREPPERRDSKDSGRSSGSSKRSSGERHLNHVDEITAHKHEKASKEKKKQQRAAVEVNSFKEEPESEDDATSTKQEIKELKAMSPEFGSNESLEDKGKGKKEKRNSGEFRKDEKKRKEAARRRETNFLTATDTDGSDDEDKPKKHSIFDIVDDGPVYISMYDKVKARSTKNMQKQEEEKRQEKMKEKFSALKQSRAKREEKKRSTSYDEDSDSESGRGKSRRKALVTSSGDSSGSDTKLKKANRVKKEEDSESDSRPKSKGRECEENTGAARTKALLNSLSRKGSRSRIVSDTSEDEHAAQATRSIPRKPKPSNIFSDDSEVDMGFAELEDAQQFKSKSRNIMDSSDEDQKQMKAKIFMDSLKLEKRIKHSNDSGAEDDVTNEVTPPPPALENCNFSGHSKEKEGVRKKSHKKKQKKQKNSQHREDPMDGDTEMPEKSDVANCVEKKKKHTSKKERRKSNHSKMVVDEESKQRRDEEKAKARKVEMSVKRDEKMEDIFGPLSEDSENSKPPTGVNSSGSPPYDKGTGKWHVSQVYGSDSDSTGPSLGPAEREARKRKEKKRRERKALDEAGKALEAKLLNDEPPPLSPIKKEIPASLDNPTNDFDVFRFTEGDESREAEVVHERNKEKRKKRKKSKEEKQNRHHHHHHHHHKHASPERKTSTPTHSELLESPTRDEEQSAAAAANAAAHSLPSLSPTPAIAPTAPAVKASLPCLSPATAKKVMLPGFDENIHETAVKSIEQFETPKVEPPRVDTEPTKEDTKLVISQEETEDAVAALLEETFGPDFGGSSYVSETDNEDASAAVIPSEVDDETAQAVESLKPDTPQSEHDLQIDTDTEDAEPDSSMTSSLDRSLCTPDPVDFNRPPKTPDLPASYFNRSEKTEVSVGPSMSEGLMERISDIARSRSPPLLVKMEPAETPKPVTITSPTSFRPGERLSSPKAASEVKTELFENTPCILPAPKLEVSATALLTDLKKDPNNVLVPPTTITHSPVVAHLKPLVVNVDQSAKPSDFAHTIIKSPRELASPDSHGRESSPAKNSLKNPTHTKPIVGNHQSVVTVVTHPSVVKMTPPMNPQSVPMLSPNNVTPLPAPKIIGHPQTHSASNQPIANQPLLTPVSQPAPIRSTVVNTSVVRSSVVTQSMTTCRPSTTPQLPVVNASPRPTYIPASIPQTVGSVSPIVVAPSGVRHPSAVAHPTSSLPVSPRLVATANVSGVRHPPGVVPTLSRVSPIAVSAASVLVSTASVVTGTAPVQSSPCPATTSGSVMPSLIVKSNHSNIKGPYTVAPSAVGSVVMKITSPVTAIKTSVSAATENIVSPVATFSEADKVPPGPYYKAGGGFPSPKRAEECKLDNSIGQDSDRDDDEGALCIVEDEVVKEKPVNPPIRNFKGQIKCDSPIDTKDEFWSKEVNIDSVIKTVDALCSKDDESSDKRMDQATEKPWFDSRCNSDSKQWQDSEKSNWHTDKPSEPERPWLAVKPMERAKSPAPVKEDPAATPWLSAGKSPEKVSSPKPPKEVDAIKVERPWPPSQKEENKAWLAATPVDRESIQRSPWYEAKIPEKVQMVPGVKAETWLDSKTVTPGLKEKDNGNRAWIHNLTVEQEKELGSRWRPATSPRSPIVDQKSKEITAAENLEVSPLAKEYIGNRSPLSCRAAEILATVSPLNRDKFDGFMPKEEPQSLPPMLSNEPASEEDSKKTGPGSVDSNKSPASTLNDSKDDAELSEAHENTDEDRTDTRGRRGRRGARRAQAPRAERAVATPATTPAATPLPTTTQAPAVAAPAPAPAPASAAAPPPAAATGVSTRRTRQTDHAATPGAAPIITRRGRGRSRGGTGDPANRKLADVYEFRDDSDDDSKSSVDRDKQDKPREEEEKDVHLVAPEKEKKEEVEKKDEKDEKTGRPRLILTIKSPAVAAANKEAAISTKTSVAPSATPVAVVETREEPSAMGAAGAGSTRKSRRLQEKDGSRSTVDDVIEDVVRNASVVTRSTAASAPAPGEPPAAQPASSAGPGAATRRLTRQTNRGTVTPAPHAAPVDAPAPLPAAAASIPVEQQRKSPRAPRKAAASSAATPAVRRNSSSEPQDRDTLLEDAKKATPEVPAKSPSTTPTPSGPPPAVAVPVPDSSKAPGKLSTRVLEKAKEECDREKQAGDVGSGEAGQPTMMICPETGLLIPMQEAEEGQYVPISNAAGVAPDPMVTSANVPVKLPTIIVSKQSSSTQSDPGPTWSGQTSIVKPLQTLKAHVLQQTIKQEVPNPQPSPLSFSPQKAAVFAKGVPVVQEQPKVMALPLHNPIPQNAKICVVQPDTKVNVVVAQPQGVPKPRDVILQSSQGKAALPVVTQPINPKAHLLQAVACQPLQAPAQVQPTVAKINHVSGVPVMVPAGVTAVSKPTTPMTPKAHILQSVNQVKTVPAATPLGVAHPQQAPVPVPVPSVVVQSSLHVPAVSPKGQAVAAKPSPPLSLVQPPKAHILHGTQQPFTGAVASPPLRKAPSQQPVITGASSFRAAAVPKPQHAPGGLVADLVPSTYVTSAGSAHAVQRATQSPPPAHQGDGVQHAFPPPHMASPQYVHPQMMYQYLRVHEGLLPYHLAPPPRSPIIPAMDVKAEPDLEEAGRGTGNASPTPPLELRRPASRPASGTTAHSLQSPHAHDRTTDSPQVATVYRLPHYGTAPGAATRYYGEQPPPAHIHGMPARPLPGTEAPISQPRMQVATPPHASQVPPQHDSLLMLLQRYPVMWQGLLALKNDQAAVQMHFVFGNPIVARGSLPCNSDGSTPPLRIAQRMRLEQTQIDGVTRKMQTDNEHCMLLALPCGVDTMDVLQQSNNLQTAFITYLQQKQAAGIVNIPAPGSDQAAYVVHVFPSCEFANESLARIAPDLFHRVANLAHLLIIIATV